MVSLEKAKEYMNGIVTYLRKDENVPPELLVPAFDVQKYLNGLDESDIPKKVDVSGLRGIKFSMQYYLLLKGVFKGETNKIAALEEAYKSQENTLLDVLYSTELLIHRRAGRCFENILNPSYREALKSATKDFGVFSFLE